MRNLRSLNSTKLEYNHDVDRETVSWSTQNGVKRLIKDLSDSHLANIIEYMSRKSNEGNEAFIKFLKTEQAYRENNNEFVEDYPSEVDPEEDLSKYFSFKSGGVWF